MLMNSKRHICDARDSNPALKQAFHAMHSVRNGKLDLEYVRRIIKTNQGNGIYILTPKLASQPILNLVLIIYIM